MRAEAVDSNIGRGYEEGGIQAIVFKKRMGINPIVDIAVIKGDDQRAFRGGMLPRQMSLELS